MGYPPSLLGILKPGSIDARIKEVYRSSARSPSSASPLLLLLLHSVMQFKYFSEALLARLGADFPSQYQLEIVHYTSLGAGKELESFPLQTPGYWI